MEGLGVEAGLPAPDSGLMLYRRRANRSRAGQCHFWDTDHKKTASFDHL